MGTHHIPLRVLFYKDDGDWVAHCLEFDLVGNGPTKEEASECLAEAIRVQLEATLRYNNPANLFSPAPGRFLEMFAAGRDVLKTIVCFEDLRTDYQSPCFVEGVQVREYSEGELEPA